MFSWQPNCSPRIKTGIRTWLGLEFLLLVERWVLNPLGGKPRQIRRVVEFPPVQEISSIGYNVHGDGIRCHWNLRELIIMPFRTLVPARILGVRRSSSNQRFKSTVHFITGCAISAGWLGDICAPFSPSLNVANWGAAVEASVQSSVFLPNPLNRRLDTSFWLCSPYGCPCESTRVVP